MVADPLGNTTWLPNVITNITFHGSMFLFFWRGDPLEIGTGTEQLFKDPHQDFRSRYRKSSLFHRILKRSHKRSVPPLFFPVLHPACLTDPSNELTTRIYFVLRDLPLPPRRKAQPFFPPRVSTLTWSLRTPPTEAQKAPPFSRWPPLIGWCERLPFRRRAGSFVTPQSAVWTFQFLSQDQLGIQQ